MASLSSRSTLHLYRDLLRLARHVGAENNNTSVLCDSIRVQFKMNRFETNPDTIEEKRADAIRALTNYFVYTATKEGMFKSVEKSVLEEVENDEK